MSLKNNSYFECQLEFKGPVNSQYEQGNFFVTISIPESNVASPPTIRFDTNIFHVNVDPITREFAPSILSSHWTESCTLKWVIDSILNIISHPMPDYYTNYDACYLYNTDPSLYYTRGQEWTAYYSPSTLPITPEIQLNPTDPSSVQDTNILVGPRDPEPESIKVDQSTEINNKYFACSKCGCGEIELVLTECRHTYHLKCFNNFCDQCNADAQINPPPSKSPKKNGCRFCGSSENLLLCDTCTLKTCFLCISFKVLPECCEKSFADLEAFKSPCPGCDHEVSYQNFLPIKCLQHPLLCTKCLSLSFSVRTCILGCKLPTSLSDFIHCEICQKYQKPFNSQYRCLNKCKVCEVCQWKSLLTKKTPGEDTECLFCSDPLVR